MRFDRNVEYMKGDQTVECFKCQAMVFVLISMELTNVISLGFTRPEMCFRKSNLNVYWMKHAWMKLRWGRIFWSWERLEAENESLQDVVSDLSTRQRVDSKESIQVLWREIQNKTTDWMLGAKRKIRKNHSNCKSLWREIESTRGRAQGGKWWWIQYYPTCWIQEHKCP